MLDQYVMADSCEMNESGVGKTSSVDMLVDDEFVDGAVGRLSTSVRALFAARPDSELMGGEVSVV